MIREFVTSAGCAVFVRVESIGAVWQAAEPNAACLLVDGAALAVSGDARKIVGSLPGWGVDHSGKPLGT
jgi:hypothetical protein